MKSHPRFLLFLKEICTPLVKQEKWILQRQLSTSQKLLRKVQYMFCYDTVNCCLSLISRGLICLL